MRRTVEEDPWLSMLFQEYDQCRAQQLVVFRKPDRHNKNKEQIVVIQWPTGYSILPNDGGYQAQSYVTMRIFAAFMRGERAAVGKLMNR